CWRRWGCCSTSPPAAQRTCAPSMPPAAPRAAPRAGPRARPCGNPRPTSHAPNRHDGAVGAASSKVVIAAGGTAGHVVPALAVAGALRAEGAEVAFIGAGRAEAELVPRAG